VDVSTDNDRFETWKALVKANDCKVVPIPISLSGVAEYFVARNGGDKIVGAFSFPWTSGMRAACWFGGEEYDSPSDAVDVLVNGHGIQKAAGTERD
jgi:hypothetical protein